jgi:NADP-dependent 3-hydroxy acid dehydrogenase YdfG
MPTPSAISPDLAEMEPLLEGKVALVTAASEGLGLACALRLAAAGCRVGICARHAEALAEAAREIGRRAAFLTGATIQIDGGNSRGLL